MPFEMFGQAPTPELERLLDEAALALDDGNPKAAVTFCAHARKLAGERAEPPLRKDLHLLEAMALSDLGACEEALSHLDAALALDPESLEAALERALALFELCRFEEAAQALRRFAERAPDEPWALHTMGLLA
jgi:tetratricopeptide (TPR) repeat protein